MLTDLGGDGPAGSRGWAAYHLLQALATLGWWTAVATSPQVRTVFAFGDDGASLWQFLPADLLFWCGGSLAVAVAAWSGRRWAGAASWVLLGAVGCSWAHSVALAWQARAGWSGVALMAIAVAMTARSAWCLSGGRA
jgi:hypothetical protein